MGSFSIWHWIIVLAIVLLLFGGGGKIPNLMGDFAKGIKNFKKGLSDEDDKPVANADATPPTPPASPKPLDHQAAPTAHKDETKAG